MTSSTQASPKRGETFKLTEALRPRIIVLEVAKALGLQYPPILLTYTGQTSAFLVRKEFRL